MKKLIQFTILTAVLGGLSSGLIYMQVKAQFGETDGRVDAFTFLIPYAADQLDEQFNAGRVPLLNITRIEVTISIAVQKEGMKVYYDHWEDGLEGDLTFPTQSSTEIWGDNDPTNGIPPLFATDVFTSGSVMILRNSIPITYSNPLPTNPPFLFDGGDAFTGVGGALAATLIFWPLEGASTNRPGILYSDAWELYPTNRWGSDYIVPIGQDLVGLRAGFAVVGLNVQALQDDTNVQIDINGDGFTDLTTTLDYGGQYNTIDGVSSGARVQASAPVQVHVIATDPQERFEARGYTMVPVSQWTHDYLAPRSSDGNYWLYNPDPTNPLEIRAQSVTTTTIITIPPISTAKFPPGNAITITTPTGMRFTSIFTPPTQPRPFYGMVALDQSSAQDWGYDVLPVDNLTPQTLVGMGIGNNSDPIPPFSPDGDESPVYVTALVTTTVIVDYDNNPNTLPNDPYLITPLAEVAITDPDHDLTGAFIYTQDETPFVAVWGQDQTANPADPSIDAGAGIVPLRSLLIQKTFSLLEDVDCSGLISPDDTVRFKLEYFNNMFTPISHVTITDTMPSALAYVPDSIVVDGVPIPDSAGNALFAGGYDAGTVDGLNSGILTFDAQVRSTTGPIINRAGARSQDLPLGGDSVTIFVPTGVVTPVMQLGTTLIEPADGVITGGQTITFGLTITNTGSVTITKLPLQNDFSEVYLSFLNAAPPPDLTATGVITWSDLVLNFGQIPPGGTVNLTLSYIVDQLPPSPDDVFNTITVIEARRSDSPLPLTCQTEVDVSIIAPTPTPTPTPTNTPTGTPTSTGTPSPTPTSFGTPSPTPTATPTSRTPSPTPTSKPPEDNDTPPPPATQPPGGSVPPASPPSAGGTPPPFAGSVTPVGMGTVMPVTVLPETGTFTPRFRDVIVGGTLLLLAGSSLSAGAYLFWQKLKQK